MSQSEEFVVTEEMKSAIERAEKAAAEKCADAFQKKLEASLQPFAWEVPKLSPAQIARSAKLQERDTLRRFIDLDFNQTAKI